MERLTLLVSDVDNTLPGDDRALRGFADWYEGAQQHVRLAYNSGRFFDTVHRSVQESHLPEPDAIIGGVGTEIRFPPDGRWLDTWPRTGAGWDPKAIRAVVAAHPELEPQPDHLQSQFKLSFYGHELGNDAEMFRHGFRGIVVGNAHPELKALTSENVYHAHGHFAAGVLEGLRYWQENKGRESRNCLDSPKAIDGR